jgi:hypothetical protein
VEKWPRDAGELDWCRRRSRIGIAFFYVLLCFSFFVTEASFMFFGRVMNFCRWKRSNMICYTDVLEFMIRVDDSVVCGFGVISRFIIVFFFVKIYHSMRTFVLQTHCFHLFSIYYVLSFFCVALYVLMAILEVSLGFYFLHYTMSHDWICFKPSKKKNHLSFSHLTMHVMLPFLIILSICLFFGVQSGYLEGIKNWCWRAT